MKKIVPLEKIEHHILYIRGHKIMLDNALSDLYGVKIKVLVQAVKRNLERFPPDFMFQLSPEEHDSLRSQSVTLKTGRGKHRKFLPYAFTEQGVSMLSSVLNSKRAVQVNIAIMRAFVRLREFALTHHELAAKLSTLERKYDSQFKVVFDAIKELMSPPHIKKKKIGFHVGDWRLRKETFLKN